jgi:BirA family transcriptional regulator, biotin operon repressor / biotin---[acetyl-CoA-carboxylase] ligase
MPPPAPCSDVRLAPEIETLGYRLITLDSVESTNDEAAAAARRGEPGRLWIVAREQRAGRGRHGRPWTSPPGNLYASLLLVDPCAPAVAPQLGFIAGVALHEAVASETGLDPPRLALKWPNDLLLDGAKVAGLLLEAHRCGDGTFAVVIGFGVNIATAPDNTAYPAKALCTFKRDLSVGSLFASLSRSFAQHFEPWRKAQASSVSDPFGTIRSEWTARAAGLGGPVTIRLPGGERSGSFLGLDEAGRLRLRTAAGTELIDAGDLYFPQLQRPEARSASASR